MGPDRTYGHNRNVQNFLDLCLSSSWPDITTKPEDVENKLFFARDVEEIMKNTLSETLFNKEILVCGHSDFLENCLADPPKLILRKIINSNAPVGVIGDAFRLFQNIFSEERLINSLADLMVNAASTETLMRNMPTMLPQQKLLQVNSKFLLSEIKMCESPLSLVNMIKHSNQQLMDLLVVCLLEEDQTNNGVQKILKGFKQVMSCNDNTVKNFWVALFNVKETNFIKMCSKYDDLKRSIFKAIKIIHEQINQSPGSSDLPCTLPELNHYIQKIKML